jgi:hypothetical protein
VVKHKKLGDLRSEKLKVKIEPKSYEELLWNKTKKTSYLTKLLKKLR